MRLTGSSRTVRQYKRQRHTDREQRDNRGRCGVDIHERMLAVNSNCEVQIKPAMLTFIVEDGRVCRYEVTATRKLHDPQTKKGPTLRWGLEGIPEPEGYERTRGDNQKN